MMMIGLSDRVIKCRKRHTVSREQWWCIARTGGRIYIVSYLGTDDDAHVCQWQLASMQQIGRCPGVN